MLFDCGLKGSVCQRNRGVGDDCRGGHLVHDVVGHRERRRLSYAFDVAEHRFDLARRDLFAASVDDLVLATGEEDQASFIDPSQVP